MSEALEYFKKVYQEVPAWVQIMHDYNPKMLEYYTNIRSEAFKTAVLSDKEKDELIAAFNAGRLYDRSMVYHTQAALNKGSKLEDLIEYFLVAYLYKGTAALEMSLKAIAQYINDKEGINLEAASNYNSLEKIIEQIRNWTQNMELPIMENLLKNSDDPEKIRSIILSDGAVTKSRKHLALVGMYITELDGKGAGPFIEEARSNGVTEEELADLGYVIILTAGIPSWFEISDHLQAKEN